MVEQTPPEAVTNSSVHRKHPQSSEIRRGLTPIALRPETSPTLPKLPRVPPPPQTRDNMIALPSLSMEARHLRASPPLHHLYSGPLAAPPTPHHPRHPLPPHSCADRASPA